MATLKDIIQDVIFEEKTQNLKLFYDIDVFIQEFKEKEEQDDTAEQDTESGDDADTNTVDSETAGTEQVDAGTESESNEDTIHNGEYLREAVYKRKVEGELVVPKEEAMNIQTLQDLVDYMSDKSHTAQKRSSVAKVLGKKGKEEDEGKIITPTIQEVILILAGAGTGALDNIVDIGDKVIVQVMYGKDKYDNIGFKINKNSGTDTFSIMLVKDGEILAGQFNQTALNKMILTYRNSIA